MTTGDYSSDANLLLELRERGWFDSADAIEVCGRCWRRAERAIGELQHAQLVKRVGGATKKKARWQFRS